MDLHPGLRMQRSRSTVRRELDGRVTFMPLGFETAGARGTKCVKFLK